MEYLQRQAKSDSVLRPPHPEFAHLDVAFTHKTMFGNVPAKDECERILLHAATAPKPTAAAGQVHRLFGTDSKALVGSDSNPREGTAKPSHLGAARGLMKGGLWGAGAMICNTAVPRQTQQIWAPKTSIIVAAVDRALSNAYDSDSAPTSARLLTGPLIFSFNSNPAGSFFDLHSDRGLAGVCASYDCMKLWIFYPPTPTNRAAFIASACDGSPGISRLERAAPSMESPLVVFTRMEDCLLVPPGWFHATYTTRAGSLLGADFLTSNAAHVQRAVEGIADEWVICAEGGNIDDMLGSRGMLQALVQEVKRCWPTAETAPEWVRVEMQKIVDADMEIACPANGKPKAWGEVKSTIAVLKKYLSVVE